MKNNNLEEEVECSGVLRVKTWLQSFELSISMSCVMFLLSLIVLAVLPGMVILGHAQNLLLDTPTDGSLLLWTVYAFKTVAVSLATVAVSLCCANVAFPAFMAVFALILNHTSLPDSVHHQ